MSTNRELEAQIRAVHHTMRCIETVRSPRFRVGPELTAADRSAALTRLSNELNSIDRELRVQHRSCEDMQDAIRKIQATLDAVRERVTGE